jgi:hypothetical protein
MKAGCATLAYEKRGSLIRNEAPPVIPIFRGYQSIVRFDNGARDGQSHTHTFGLGSDERFEDLFQFVIGNAMASIRHR